MSGLISFWLVSNPLTIDTLQINAEATVKDTVSLSKMGVALNYTGGGRNMAFKKRSKLYEDQRRDRQVMAERKLNEAVNRVVKSKQTTEREEKIETCRISSDSSRAPWAFSHARVEGHRQMGPASSPVALRASRMPSGEYINQIKHSKERQSVFLIEYLTQLMCPLTAYAKSASQRQLDRKKALLLSCADWAGLDDQNTRKDGRITTRSRSKTILEDVRPMHTSFKHSDKQEPSSPSAASVSLLSSLPRTASTERTAPDRSSNLRVPSSPPLLRATDSMYSMDGLPSLSFASISSKNVSQSNTGNDFVNSSLQEGDLSQQSDMSLMVFPGTPVPLQSTPKSTALTLTAARQTSSVPMRESNTISPTLSSSGSVYANAGLQYLSSPFRRLRHIDDLPTKALVFNFLLPCMDHKENGAPFEYDGDALRSTDYLQMAYSGPDMDL